MRLYMVFAEAGIELVPPVISSHPSVRSWAVKRGKPPSETLLDISYHYAAIRKLKDWVKRGRPDIVHMCLLLALGSPLNRKRFLEIYVHTYDNKIIYVNPKTNLPRNYMRFIGLMEQLLIEGAVPPRAHEKLLFVEKGGLETLIDRVRPDSVILLSEKGTRLRLTDFSDKIKSCERPMLIIGAFQRGEFRRENLNLADNVVSLYDEVLDAWTITSMVLRGVEISLGLI